jgi:DNA-binding NtrC family response regulator
MGSSAIRVLVVDDEQPVRVSLGSYLQDREFEVLTAESGEDAIELLERETVDWAIVDIRLPGIDGNTLILKARQLRPDLKFIIYTGSVNYQLPPSLQEIGFSDKVVFHKPLANMGDIIEAIQQDTNKGGPIP